MKKKLPPKLYAKQKAEILAAVSVPGSTITNLSKTYGVGRGTIYAWVSQQKKSLAIKQKRQGPTTIAEIITMPKFLEVAVTEQVETKKLNEPIKLRETLNLSNCSLIFDDFSLAIEGKIASTKLISILRILEE